MTKTLKVTLPDGSTATRKTDRTYTHIVVAKSSYDYDLKRANDPAERELDGTNYDHYAKILRVGVGGIWSDERGYTVDQHNYDDAAQRLNGVDTREEYVERELRFRLDRVQKQKEHGHYNRWGVLGWCGRKDLADKLANSNRYGPIFTEITILPVPA